MSKVEIKPANGKAHSFQIETKPSNGKSNGKVGDPTQRMIEVQEEFLNIAQEGFENFSARIEIQQKISKLQIELMKLSTQPLKSLEVTEKAV